MLIDEKIKDLQNLIKRKVTYDELAPILGVKTGQAVRNRKSRKKPLAEFEIKKIDEAFKNEINKACKKNIVQQIVVDYYPDVIASCGPGGFEMSQECIQYEVPATLFPPARNVKGYSMCHAKGNSMFPRIWDGDFVICEHKDNMKIENGEMYIFCYDDQIYLKRLTKNINQIVVESENPDFPTQYIEKEQMNDVHLIGHVICSGRMNGKYLDKRV